MKEWILTNKKRIGIVVLLCFVLVVVIITMQVSKKDMLLQDTLSFEYGVEIYIDAKDIVNTKDAFVLETFSVDYTDITMEENTTYPKIGEYQVPISYKENNIVKKDVLNIQIVDTTSPKFIDFNDQIKIELNSQNIVFENYFMATDLNMDSIRVDSHEVDVIKVGEYTIEVIAEDTCGNQTKKQSSVIVLEKTDMGNDQVSYVQGVLIINKKHGVSKDYAPGEGVEAGDAVRSLINDMQMFGLDVSDYYSGYRSYDYQDGLYQKYVDVYDVEITDTFSARPGYSEHQSGLAFDLLHYNGSLIESADEVRWVAENAHRYGFIVRYQLGKEEITGYQAEPWHLRYLGVDLATQVYQSELCLEEYLGVEGGGYDQ